MRYRRLGRTELAVSEIGIGTWGVGGLHWGARDDQRSIGALNAALDLGVNFIDTAFGYGDGNSERLIGRVLASRGPRDRPIVATKIPLETGAWPATDDMRIEDCYSADWIRSCTEVSMSRLGVERLDLQQFHMWTDAWADEDEWRGVIADLKREGKIRFFGVSTNDHEPDSVLRLIKTGEVDTVQVIYNVFDQSAADRLFPLCESLDIGVIARSPFDEGGLTGTLRDDTVFEPGDWRSGYFQGARLGETVARARAIESTTPGHVADLAEGALRFCLSHQAVATVIPGMRSSAHVALNCAVSDGSLLSADVLTSLAKHSWARNFYQDAW